MKKTLLAAALVTGFAGVAHAESSVTLYGIVDAGYGYQQSETEFSGNGFNGEIKNKNFGVHSGVQNGSRWGLKGSEDLGNGTSAIFVLESGFDVGTGRSQQDDRLFGRQAYVGLTNDSWGTFTIGRQYNAGDTFVAPIDPFGTGWGYAGAENIFGDSVSGRYDGVLKYVSPVFSGFQFGIGLVHETDDWEYEREGYDKIEHDIKTTGVTLGASYTGGPLYVGASFDYQRQENNISGNVAGWPTVYPDFVRDDKDVDDKVKAWNIGMTYDFDVVKLHALYGGQKDGVIGGIGRIANPGENFSSVHLGLAGFAANGLVGDGMTQHSWLVGLSAPVGDAGEVMFSYAGNTIKNDDASFDNLGTTTSFDGAKAKSHNFALGYRHGLSKRTSVYGVASYGWSDFERNGGTNWEAESTATQVIIGLQHRF